MSAVADTPARAAPAGWLAANDALAFLAVGMPTLLAFSLPPSATFLNQAVAVVGWGAWLLLIAASGALGPWRAGRGLACLLAGLGLACAAAAVSWAQHLPGPLAVSSMTMILAAAGVAAVGALLARAELAQAVFRSLCVALLTAGLLSVLIGVIQLFFPQLATGELVAATSHEGRAVGNLRQPNHLSSLLLWSLVAALWLGERYALRRAVVAAASAVLVFGIVMTASRTGVIGIGLLLIWGLLDRRLSRSSRVLLVALPLLYALFWWGLSEWAHETRHVFGGERRFSADGDISSSRFAIWRDTLSLIAAHPWFGVGFGEFNFAWSLTPFPQRPVAFFDHTHNLELQLLVELGLPLGSLVLALLAYALWRAFIKACDAGAPDVTARRAAFVMLSMMVVHSQLEYPLWYAYFLLPTAFVFGLCLRSDAAETARTVLLQRATQIGAVLMLAGGLAGVFDYLRVAAIFESDERTPLAQRIADGERSWFFAHHAHYAAATIADHPSHEMASFGVAPHYLLDTRLMIAWARALNEAGDIERARHLAQRLREFRNEDAKPFFAECEAAKPLPFQCTPPTHRFDYRDFR